MDLDDEVEQHPTAWAESCFYKTFIRIVKVPRASSECSVSPGRLGVHPLGLNKFIKLHTI